MGAEVVERADASPRRPQPNGTALSGAANTAASVPLVLFERLHRFVELGRAVRRARTPAELGFLICNRSRDLVDYRQAVLWESARDGSAVITYASGVAEVDRSAAYVRALEHVLRDRRATSTGVAATSDPESPALPALRELALRDAGVEAALDSELAAEWQEHAAPYGVLIPLAADGARGLLLLREQPLIEAEGGVLAEVQELYAHALAGAAPSASTTPSLRTRWNTLSRRTRWALLVAALAVLFFPVRLSVVAPAQLIARDPAVLTAPVNGVVREVLVAPSAPVRAGQVLYRIDDREIGSQLAIAEEELAAAEERARQFAQRSIDADTTFASGQSATGNPDFEVARARAERDYYAELAARVEVRAPRDGVALFSSPQDWIGRPVKIGEKVMEVAAPTAVELEAWLPAADAIDLRSGDEVLFYPEAAPLSAVRGQVRSIAYLAEVQEPSGTLAYRVRADVVDGATDVARVGRLGTARLHGERSVLIYLLLRAPANALRQWLGW